MKTREQREWERAEAAYDRLIAQEEEWAGAGGWQKIDEKMRRGDQEASSSQDYGGGSAHAAGGGAYLRKDRSRSEGLRWQPKAKAGETTESVRRTSTSEGSSERKGYRPPQATERWGPEEYAAILKKRALERTEGRGRPELRMPDGGRESTRGTPAQSRDPTQL